MAEQAPERREDGSDRREIVQAVPVERRVKDRRNVVPMHVWMGEILDEAERGQAA